MKNKLSRRHTIKLLGLAGLSGVLPATAGRAGSTTHISHNNTVMSHPSGAMLSRIIPATNELLPVVGLGSWIQFDVSNNEQEREPLKGVIQALLDKGGKMIDSSPMYGRSEEVIGDLTAASGKADELFYATKVWTSGEQAGIEQMNRSMQLMKRKTMDLMQVHNLMDYKTHLKTLKKWKAEGKVRYVGVTHYTTSAHAQLQQIVESKTVDFVQFNYSIRVRNAGKSLLSSCLQNGVAVIINEPFEKGDLFRLTKGKKLPAWTADYDIKTWAQYFLKYILSNAAVNCVIPGTSNPSHALDNMEAGYGRMPDAPMRKKMVEFIEAL
jgi:diketogulonate reductase-like aldo/keto reductase